MSALIGDETVEAEWRSESSPDNFWKIYLNKIEEGDKSRADDWEGDTSGTLIFTGLFAAVVAAFVIESYKQLSPDTGVQAVALLSKLTAATNGSVETHPLSVHEFTPPASAVIANTLWFLSLILSLICALGATLIQRWTRRYLHATRCDRSTLQKRGIAHIVLSQGAERFGLTRASSLVVFLLHVAVILFMIGLIAFLFPINAAVAIASAVTVVLAGCAYLVLTVLPGLFPGCPYFTPFTPALSAITWLAHRSLSALVLCLKKHFPSLSKSNSINTSSMNISFSRAKQKDPSLNLSLSVYHIIAATKQLFLHADDLSELKSIYRAFCILFYSFISSDQLHSTSLAELRLMLKELDLVARIKELLESQDDGLVWTGAELSRHLLVIIFIFKARAPGSQPCEAGSNSEDPLQDIHSVHAAWASVCRRHRPSGLAFHVRTHATFAHEHILRVTASHRTQYPSFSTDIHNHFLQYARNVYPPILLHSQASGCEECCSGFASGGDLRHIYCACYLTWIIDLFDVSLSEISRYQGFITDTTGNICEYLNRYLFMDSRLHGKTPWPTVEEHTNLEPSSQLKDIFARAGLSTWLEPNSRFSYPDDAQSSELYQIFPRLFESLWPIACYVTGRPPYPIVPNENVQGSSNTSKIEKAECLAIVKDSELSNAAPEEHRRPARKLTIADATSTLSSAAKSPASRAARPFRGRTSTTAETVISSEGHPTEGLPDTPPTTVLTPSCGEGSEDEDISSAGTLVSAMNEAVSLALPQSEDLQMPRLLRMPTLPQLAFSAAIVESPADSSSVSGSLPNDEEMTPTPDEVEPIEDFRRTHAVGEDSGATRDATSIEQAEQVAATRPESKSDRVEGAEKQLFDVESQTHRWKARER